MSPSTKTLDIPTNSFDVKSVIFQELPKDSYLDDISHQFQTVHISLDITSIHLAHLAWVVSCATMKQVVLIIVHDAMDSFMFTVVELKWKKVMDRLFGATNVRLPMQQGKRIPLLLESKGVRIDCMTACWYQQQRSFVQ